MRKQTVRPSLKELHAELASKAVRLGNELVLDKASGRYGDTINFHGSFVVPTKEKDENSLVRVVLNFKGGLLPMVKASFELLGGGVEEYIKPEKIEKAYRAAFKSCSQHAFWLADSKYKPTNMERLQQVLLDDKTEDVQYVSEYFDCDDFSFSLMGAVHHRTDTGAIPFFITWVQWQHNGNSFLHAINSFLLNGQVVLIEPQSDGLYSVPEDWSLFLLIG